VSHFISFSLKEKLQSSIRFVSLNECFVCSFRNLSPFKLFCFSFVNCFAFIYALKQCFNRWDVSFFTHFLMKHFNVQIVVSKHIWR
jgi:hypothetical protein